MASTVGRNVAAPLLFLNLVMYFITLGFSGWCLNKYINHQTNHPSFGGNGATEFFLEFAILASVLGIVSKFAGGNHLRAWRNDSLAAAGSTSLVAWAVTVLAFGLACKEIIVGGHRGWRLRIVEAFIIILTITDTTRKHRTGDEYHADDTMSSAPYAKRQKFGMTQPRLR